MTGYEVACIKAEVLKKVSSELRNCVSLGEAVEIIHEMEREQVDIVLGNPVRKT
tara:strand:+ start:202 stop:363 length:162 start_codon:yes stop_codon:yes gene_type:complete